MSSLDSLVFFCRRCVYWGSCKTRFPSRLPCRFAWQAWHLLTFSCVCESVESRFVWRCHVTASFSEDELHFSWQAQHFGDHHRHFAWQAQHLVKICHVWNAILRGDYSFSDTLHFTLRSLHSTLDTLHFTLYNVDFTLHTPHYTLHTLHSTLHTLHFTLHTLHFRL